MLDTAEINKVMQILEELEETDEQLAIELLKEFNEKTKYLGQLLMDRDPNLNNDEWKIECDQAKKEVDNLLKKIFSL